MAIALSVFCLSACGQKADNTNGTSAEVSPSDFSYSPGSSSSEAFSEASESTSNGGLKNGGTYKFN